MSLFVRALGPWDTAESAIPRRGEISVHGTVPVTMDSSLRHSAVWACLRLRANLISTMPVDTYRKVDGISIDVPKPDVLIIPGGERVPIEEWLYSTQMDLDRAGNTFGLITERYGTGLPSRIELQPISECSVVCKKGKITYRFSGKEYQPYEVWHEKQYTVSGIPFGLSPIAYAAWTIGEYLSIQDFVTNWFSTGGLPKGHVKNIGVEVSQPEATSVKERFRTSMASGDVWVTGRDWEYVPISAEKAGNEWITAKQMGVTDVARFLDCPADLIDAAVSGSSVTYANIVQRNLQFLIMSLGPTVIRREKALSGLLAKPRFVKLNTDALLRMDADTRAKMQKIQIDSRTRTPTEIRELEDLRALTPEEAAEFDRYWPAKQAPAPTKAITP